MKKIISLIILTLMLFQVSMPINAFAQEDKGLESAILASKSKLNIPESFTKFTYDIYSNNNEQIWNLKWSSENKQDGEILVSINKEGQIINYNYFKPYKKSEKKIPKYTKEEAKKISDKFIQNMEDNLLDRLKYVEDDSNDITNETYNYRYTRLINNVPFYNDEVNIQVNKETGEVISYICNWSKNINFANSSNVISLEKAKEKYAKELGLKLIYRSKYTEKKTQPYLVYVPKYDSNYVIDATTGEKIKIEMPIIAYGKNATLEDSMVKPNLKLNPQELEAIKNVSKLITKEEAINIAQKLIFLGLTSEYNLKYANLNKNYKDDSKFQWDLNFETENKEDVNRKYISLSIDAITSEILNFNISKNYNNDLKAKFTKEDGKNAVDKFLKEFCANKYELTKIDDAYDDFINDKTEQDVKYYNFKFNRVVNKIPYEDNYIVVGFDAISGTVNYFYSQWDNVDFPSTSNVINIDKAYDILFKKIGLELQYKIDYNKDNKDAKEAKLVYALNNDIPQNIQANNGEIINYDKTPYKKNKASLYKDINDHYAQKQIDSLKEHGIGFDGEYFYPDKKITQADFFKLYIKTLDFYGNSSDDKKYIEDMYSYLISQNILTESEVKPDSIITKMDVLRYIINGLNYENIAKVNKIYNCPFKDVIKETPQFTGYASIGYGLGIVSGYNGNLDPKKELTRADAAIMIYNYLNK